MPFPDLLCQQASMGFQGRRDHAAKKKQQRMETLRALLDQMSSYFAEVRQEHRQATSSGAYYCCSWRSPGSFAPQIDSFELLEEIEGDSPAQTPPTKMTGKRCTSIAAGKGACRFRMSFRTL